MNWSLFLVSILENMTTELRTNCCSDPKFLLVVIHDTPLA